MIKISVNCKLSRSAMTPTGPDSKNSSRQQKPLLMQALHCVNPKIVSDCVFVLFFSHFLFIVSVMNMLSVISDKAARRRNKKEKVLVCVCVCVCVQRPHSRAQHHSAPYGTAQHNFSTARHSTAQLSTPLIFNLQRLLDEYVHSPTSRSLAFFIELRTEVDHTNIMS